MTQTFQHQPDPKLDLVLERVVDVPRELVWKVWTTPEHLKKWFTPAPWTTIACEIDLRPGGLFSTTMRSPEGIEFPNEGCYLEIIENEKLVFTNTVTRGYRPAPHNPEGLPFTAVITLEAHGNGTKYTALAIHGEEEVCARHAGMGFKEGWGAALDQLVELAKTMK